MAKKKKLKLKTFPKILMCLLVILCVVGYFGYKKYKEYLYTQTNEYALLQLGYSAEDSKTIEDNLNDDEIKKVLTYEYNEFIPHFIDKKYFLFKNLDGYLSQVVTQDEDFFKYHGVDGYDYDDIISTVNVHRDKTVYEYTISSDTSKGYAIISNKYYELGSDYEPDDLVDIEIKYYYGSPKKIRTEVYEAFKKMWNAAYEDGIYLIVDSAYRTYASQQEVYTLYDNQFGTKYADSIAARPGFSEHQTGLALDIYSKECMSAKTFKDSASYAWLVANSYKYGFILRYPEGKSKITGYNYESWHYRYLGVELATKVNDSGLTYDEYYAYYLED